MTSDILKGATIDEVMYIPETKAVEGCYELFEKFVIFAGGSSDDAFTIDEMGILITDSRWMPPINEVSNSLFPYDIASNYTRDLSLWKIEKQNGSLLGHNTLVIRGVLNNYASEKSQAKTFRFWVDKDSGVLVMYETYNTNGEVVDYLHPKEMKINIPVGTSKF